MILSSLNINTQRSVSDKIRLCFWVYLILLIFEGAMRKWLLPQLSNLFLVVREPVAIYAVFLYFKYNLRSNIVKALFIFSFISFVLTLLFGHQNVLVALYGVRITLLHLPCIFIFGKVITKEDIHLIGKAILYLSVLMFIIIVIQYFSPKTAWINIGTGGSGTASFSGVGEYMRPSGTFSFISGLVEFELLVGLYLIYYLYNNKNINKQHKLNNFTLAVLIIIYFFSLALCLSRTAIFEAALMFVTMVLYMILNKEQINKIIYIIIFTIISFVILSQIDSFKLAIDNIFTRFNEASNSEGDIIEGSIGNRYFGSFYRAFFETQNYSNKEIPFFGFGIGIGTRVAVSILGLTTKGFAFAEEEWSRIVCEMGLFQGIIFLIGFRLILPLSLVYKALIYIKKRKDFFLYICIPAFLLHIINTQWAVPTSLGFTVVTCTLFVAAINQNKHNNPIKY